MKKSKVLQILFLATLVVITSCSKGGEDKKSKESTTPNAETNKTENQAEEKEEEKQEQTDESALVSSQDLSIFSMESKKIYSKKEGEKGYVDENSVYLDLPVINSESDAAFDFSRNMDSLLIHISTENQSLPESERKHVDYSWKVEDNTLTIEIKYYNFEDTERTNPVDSEIYKFSIDGDELKKIS